jgi:hypothetical protein
MTTTKVEDIEIKKVIGMDIEPEDREVGIFGASFYLVLKTSDDKQLQLYFDEDNINELIRILKPQIDEMKFQEDMDKELSKEQPLNSI